MGLQLCIYPDNIVPLATFECARDIIVSSMAFYSVFNPEVVNFDRLFLNNNKPYPHETLQLIGSSYNLDNCKISHSFDCLIWRYKYFLFFD
jgi:hypothetical protein